MKSFDKFTKKNLGKEPTPAENRSLPLSGEEKEEPEKLSAPTPEPDRSEIPFAAEPETVEPKAAEPEVAEPEEIEPDEAKPDEAKPDEAEPEEIEPEEIEPEEAEPDEPEEAFAEEPEEAFAEEPEIAQTPVAESDEPNEIEPEETEPEEIEPEAALLDDEALDDWIDPDDLPKDEEYVDDVCPQIYRRKAFRILTALASILLIALSVVLLRRLFRKKD